VAPPTIEVLVGDRTYFIDADGRRWRVYDATNDGGRVQVHRPPHRAAVHRIFVGADGARRQYQFRDGDTRILSATALQRQLTASTITREAAKRAGWAEQRLRDDY
jgi:hypothetical protein